MVHGGPFRSRASGDARTVQTGAISLYRSSAAACRHLSRLADTDGSVLLIDHNGTHLNMRLLRAIKRRLKQVIVRPSSPDATLLSGVPASLPADLRELLAIRYIAGSGIEFGALHFPLAVPPGTTVRYADMHDVAGLNAAFPDVKSIGSVDIVTDLESMRGVADTSQDFVIANHVLEHVEDPLRALGSIARTLRPGGIAFLALPDKRFTFDKERRITSLDHLLRDHQAGPDGSLAEHYEEWVRCIDGLSGHEHSARVALMTKQRSNIHFHVWDYPAMQEFFAYVARDSGIALEIEASVLNGIEVVWILRKVG